jgi:hypothetical protein
MKGIRSGGAPMATTSLVGGLSTVPTQPWVRKASLAARMRAVRGYVASHGLVTIVGPLQYEIKNKQVLLDKIERAARAQDTIAAGLIWRWYYVIRNQHRYPGPLHLSLKQKQVFDEPKADGAAA